MADEEGVLTDLDNNDAAPNGADNQPKVSFLSQYIKDLSVENPNAPKSYQLNEQPSVDVQFNIAADKVGDDVTEVSLKAMLTAKAGDTTLYIIDVTYAGLIGIRNLPEEQAHAFTFAEAPRILFPFVRRVVADAVRDTGYPPMLLEPIDFNQLYIQQMQARQNQGEAGGDTPPTPQF
ncbi:MAG: protein-export chaperone SecB [Sphingomonadaceae bacterium]